MNGVNVEYRDGDGRIRGAQGFAIDFNNPDANDWLAVNQFTVMENRNTRRPDVVLFRERPTAGHYRAQEPSR